MEPQKTVDLTPFEHAKKDDLLFADDHHHNSTGHLFDPNEKKKSHDITPYSLYLMNNNWHSDPQLDDPKFKWTYSDYICGILSGILLFLGLGATELVKMYFGKTGVAIYLILFVAVFILLMARIFIYRLKK